jgi:hypothetical protein
MFTNPLPNNDDYRVVLSEYAKRYYVKRFAKDYKGTRWAVTERAILEQLKRVHAIAGTMKVDELKRGPGCLLFKYDFSVAQSGISPKASGNRCVVFLDIERRLQVILLVYGKGDMPKNQHETAWFMKLVQTEFNEMWSRLE